MRVFQRQTGADGHFRYRAAHCVLALLISISLTACDDDGVQGTLPPGTRVDSFAQTTVSKVDVLVVIDNSSSMVEEQENLAQNFDRFLSFLTAGSIDFHIGVTTTDIVNDQGKLVNASGHPAVITNTSPNPLASFAANVKVSATAGNAREAGLDAARRTFELNPQGFLRPDAWLFLIFVSDEDDSSFGVPKFFHRYFAQLKGKGNEAMVQAGAIIGDVPEGCASEQGAARPGERYAELVTLMGGRVGSICSTQFDTILQEMGIDAVGLKRKFQLSMVPDLSNLTVTTTLACNAEPSLVAAICESVENECSSGGRQRCRVKQKGESAADGWTYETGTRSIVFHGRAIPQMGSTVEIMYLEPERQAAP